MRETHRSNVFKSGDYYRECDECGFDYLRSEMLKRYDGAIVCAADFEEEHPRDLNLSTLKEAPFRGDVNAPVDQDMSESAMVNPAITTALAIAGTLSTTQMTTDLDSTTDDTYNGDTLTFTSGVLRTQKTVISDYVGSTKLLTFSAVSEAPSAGDSFTIV